MGTGTVNVGIVGVGNCASSLVQGARFCADGAGPVAGLSNVPYPGV